LRLDFFLGFHTASQTRSYFPCMSIILDLTIPRLSSSMSMSSRAWQDLGQRCSISQAQIRISQEVSYTVFKSCATGLG